jgi:hypothetical protein
MEKIFDWHNWDAETYERPEDIVRAFNSFGICGKKVTDVRAIGYVAHRAKYNTKRAQHRAGTSWEVIDGEQFVYPEQTLVPCEIELNAPVIFTFSDGSTLELQPLYQNSFRMSMNKIPSGVINSINRSNFNANILFRDLIGATIDYLEVKTFTLEGISSSDALEALRSVWGRGTEGSRQYLFHMFPSNSGFSITQRYGGWYSLELRNQTNHTYEGYDIQEVQLNLFEKAFSPSKQILIVEGHDGSSFFWIMPIKMLDDPSEYPHVSECRAEEISIEEEDVSQFLYYFLEKYFDPHIQIAEYEEESRKRFEWNLRHNIYTYESVRNMIAEIRSTADMFCNDFDNIALSKIKARFHLWMLSENTAHVGSGETDQYRDEVIRGSIEIILDFYERFCRRMESMMIHAPQYSLISFMGP